MNPDMKMKNKKLILLTIVTFILAIMLISCGHTNHEFGEWQAVKEATCTEDGLEVRVCECGRLEGRKTPKNDNVHVYGEWTVATASTCTDEGVEQRRCACGEVESRPLDKLAHVYTASEELTEPTCVDKGYTTYYCTCGESIKDSYTDPTGAHKYGAWNLYKETTVITKKIERRVCSDCPHYEERVSGGYITYVSADVLCEFKNVYSDNHPNYDSSYGEPFRYGQGGCYNGKYFYQAFVDYDDIHGVIVKVDTTTGAVVAHSEPEVIYHGNDITYNSKTNEVLVVHEGYVVVYDADSLDFKTSIYISIPNVDSWGVTAMSYNAHNDTYVLFNGWGWEFYVVDSNFSSLISRGSMTPPTKTYSSYEYCTSQGICSDENYIYSLFYEDLDGNINTFDYVTRVQVRDYNFNLVNTFTIGLGNSNHEPENISIVDGKFYLGTPTMKRVTGGLRPNEEFTVYVVEP